MDFPIVDTHVHIWDTRRLRYPWFADVPLLNRPYLIQDYRLACGPVQVEKMVFLQAEAEHALFQAEADWVNEVAETEDARLAGIVPWAPLELGEAARPVLVRLAANRRVKGIRRLIQSEPDPEFCLRPDFVRGVQSLPGYGLHFELGIVHGQLPASIRLVEACPGVRFILDHLGKPDIKQQVLDPWRQHLKVLAGFPNVWCKISGLVTEADHARWTAADLQPYIDHALDTFGFDRVMYGSDWPVATLASAYPRWVETLERAVAGCSPAELRKLFHDNALAFYRLA